MDEKSKLWWCCSAEFGEHEESCGNHPSNKRRVEQLTDIKDSLVEIHGDEAGFRNDLNEILKAINDRIELIKKGEV